MGFALFDKVQLSKDPVGVAKSRQQAGFKARAAQAEG